ncbi:MAG: translation initiation factor Sui1 [Desulfohalobiaceae bacterium]|nr:translation initiation factor Sui1 [Desulfohalobiaceae bacterium]
MTASENNTSRLVYSTEKGQNCETCGKSLAKCKCGQRAAASGGDGVVRVQRETKGRKGKGVTLVRGLPLEEEALKKLAQKLKSKCGSGGTVKDGVIEIQGNHRDQLVEVLQKEGYTVKRAGG